MPVRYTLRITRSQPEHLGEPRPVQEFADRFDTPQQAADFARALIAGHEAPMGAYTFDVVDREGAPVDGFAGLEA